jgi:hypothetical protein
LNTPFLFDDFSHITYMSELNWKSVIVAFGPVAHKPGLFFRPMGFAVFWVNSWWAGSDPWRWHLLSILLHLFNCCLLWRLCLDLGLTRWAAYCAALYLAVSGALVESVAWVDARFDPLTTCFVLVALICICAFLKTTQDVWLFLALVAGVCGMVSKESGYCFPLLVGCLAFFRPVPDRQRLKRACSWAIAVASVLFVYRYWALGGVIGGYQSGDGPPNIARLHFIHTLNALFVRVWTLLLFPVNWTLPTTVPFIGVILCIIPLLAALAWLGRIPRRQLLGCLAMTFVAALPVQHLLLIDSDFSGSRILYLPSIGWAILWGLLLSSVASMRWRWISVASIVTIQMVIAHHNLSGWEAVSRQARVVCSDFGNSVRQRNDLSIVRGLPQKKNGIVFLANGFPECVEMNSGIPRSRIQVNNNNANFSWNEQSQRVEPLPRPGLR